jgi:hypothetical protein
MLGTIMRGSMVRVALVWFFTATLFFALHPRVSPWLGLTRIDNSLFIELVDVGDPRHQLPVFPLQRALAVAGLIILYATVLASIPRGRRIAWRLALGAVIASAAAVLVCVLSFPELVAVLAGRGAYGPASPQGRLVRFVAGFPGGDSGLAVAATIVQAAFATAMLRLLGGYGGNGSSGRSEGVERSGERG